MYIGIDILVLSFIGISQLLPITAYVKMIDIWMIFNMVTIFIAVAILFYKELLRKKLSKVVTPRSGNYSTTYPILLTVSCSSS